MFSFSKKMDIGDVVTVCGHSTRGTLSTEGFVFQGTFLCNQSGVASKVHIEKTLQITL